MGLNSSPEAIKEFIFLHSPLEASIALHDAPFWNTHQQEFLKVELLNDADWAEVIDLLDSQLRAAN
jgi:hypothetical protein